jgi:hypothetical protein
LPFCQRGPEFFIAHIGISQLEEYLAGKIRAQAAVFEPFLIAAAVMKWANPRRDL